MRKLGGLVIYRNTLVTGVLKMSFLSSDTNKVSFYPNIYLKFENFNTVTLYLRSMVYVVGL